MRFCHFEVPISAGDAVRHRSWIGAMVALDVLAIVFQWVLYVVSVYGKDDGSPITKTFSNFK